MRTKEKYFELRNNNLAVRLREELRQAQLLLRQWHNKPVPASSYLRKELWRASRTVKRNTARLKAICNHLHIAWDDPHGFNPDTWR